MPLVRHFVPGRIDHHNVQMALSMALVAALVFIPRRPAAYAAGAASALSIAVGLETLPYVALGGVAVMAGWWRAPAERSAAVLAYLSAFAVAATLALAATVAPSLWLVPACDMISAVYLLPLWAALGIAAAARLGGLDRGRAGVALIVGTMALAALASVALLNPACLAGPYAEADPRVLSLWMNHLAEVRSALTLFRVEPVAAVSVFAAPLAGLAVAPVLLALPSWRDREAAAIVVGALALATMLALLQVRTLPFAAMFAAAPLAAAAALAIARRWRLRLDPIWGYAAAACLANPFAITLAAAVAAEPVLGSQAQREAHAGERLCTRRAEYRVLAGLPPGTVASLISFGSYILAETPHRVVAAPYHRNRDGVLDTIAAFTAKPDESRAILARRGVDTIAFCTTSTELDHLIGPDGRHPRQPAEARRSAGLARAGRRPERRRDAGLSAEARLTSGCGAARRGCRRLRDRFRRRDREGAAAAARHQAPQEAGGDRLRGKRKRQRRAGREADDRRRVHRSEARKPPAHHGRNRDREAGQRQGAADLAEAVDGEEAHGAAVAPAFRQQALGDGMELGEPVEADQLRPDEHRRDREQERRGIELHGAEDERARNERERQAAADAARAPTPG